MKDHFMRLLPVLSTAMLAVLTLAIARTAASDAAPKTTSRAMPEMFLVKDCTGPAEGKTLCYFCRYGRRPVVGVFTRQINDALAELIQGIDRQVVGHRDERMAAFVVYLGKDTAAAQRQLKELAEKHGITRTPLTILADDFEILKRGFGVSEDAGVSVVMWRRLRIKVSLSFAPGKFSSSAAKKVVGETAQILDAP